jgi:hypothetical protein
MYTVVYWKDNTLEYKVMSSMEIFSALFFCEEV